MSSPVYYLKISVKILNKMSVCKPQRRGTDVSSGMCPLSVSQSLLPPISSLSLFILLSSQRPMQNALANVWRERNKRNRAVEEEKEG